MEKRLELNSLSEDPKAELYTINKVECEHNTLEQKLSKRAHRTEIDQRRILTPEQINKMKDMPFRYGFKKYGKKRI